MHRARKEKKKSEGNIWGGGGGGGVDGFMWVWGGGVGIDSFSNYDCALWMNGRKRCRLRRRKCEIFFNELSVG